MPYQTTEISIDVAWVFFKGFCGILGFVDPYSSVIEGVSHVLRDLSEKVREIQGVSPKLSSVLSKGSWVRGMGIPPQQNPESLMSVWFN